MIKKWFKKTPATIDSRGVAYSCFVDSNNKFYKEVFRFIWSLNELQKVPLSDIYVTCSSCCDQKFLDKLREIHGLNVNLRDRISQVSPPSNKWLQLECIPTDKYSHIIVNDCDKLYVSFDPLIWCNENVRAAEFVPRPTFKVFEEIFSKYDLGEPEWYKSSPDPKDELQDARAYVNNHNGGLIIFPTAGYEEIVYLWKKWIDRLHDDISLLGKNHRNLDQVAFSLALHEFRARMDFVPKSLDIGLNVRRFSEKWKKEKALVLHIHGSDDRLGLLIPSESAAPELRALSNKLNVAYSEWARDLGVFSLLNKLSAVVES